MPLPRKAADTPIARIQSVVRRIPRGKVSTYGSVAEAAGIPGGARVAVRALKGAGDLPWFRVVAAGGRIALPGESGYDQRLRLEIEGVKFRGTKVDMARFEHKWRVKAASKAPRSPRAIQS